MKEFGIEKKILLLSFEVICVEKVRIMLTFLYYFKYLNRDA